MVKIKFCGMTNTNDCKRAACLGVDFVGFVFYEKSRRAVTPATVRRIVDQIAGEVLTVGVFVDESDEEIEEIVRYCGLDYAQVYRPSALTNAIRAVPVGTVRPDTPEDGLVLFDSETKSVGGSGKPFDLDLLAGCNAIGRAFIAGGIDDANVEKALRMGPFGVDLASSVEAQPGRKDHGKMERFVKKVRGFVI